MNLVHREVLIFREREREKNNSHFRRKTKQKKIFDSNRGGRVFFSGLIQRLLTVVKSNRSNQEFFSVLDIRSITKKIMRLCFLSISSNTKKISLFFFFFVLYLSSRGAPLDLNRKKISSLLSHVCEANAHRLPLLSLRDILRSTR